MASEDHIERTFVMIKPDGVQRGLVGEIVARLEQKGLELRALKLKNLDIETARKHYAEHRDKPFYDHLVYYVTSGSNHRDGGRRIQRRTEQSANSSARRILLKRCPAACAGIFASTRSGT